MNVWKRIQNNLRQIFAIAEKNFKISMRYKVPFIMGYVQPFIQLIFPLIIMGQFFSYQDDFGPWTQENYIIYLFVGYNIMLLQKIIGGINSDLSTEKYWRTLQALMIAPFNRINLLFGFILTHLLQISFPFAIFFIICYIFFPISVLTILLIIGMMFSILLIFAGIGLIIGVFQVSNENIARALAISLGLYFSFSCISYPYEIFPPFIQLFINFNPFYYIIDIVRLTWLEDDIYFTIISHPNHFFVLISFFLICPVIGIIMFNYIFKKYGIVGY